MTYASHRVPFRYAEDIEDEEHMPAIVDADDCVVAFLSDDGLSDDDPDLDTKLARNGYLLAASTTMRDALYAALRLARRNGLSEAPEVVEISVALELCRPPEDRQAPGELLSPNEALQAARQLVRDCHTGASPEDEESAAQKIYAMVVKVQ